MNIILQVSLRRESARARPLDATSTVGPWKSVSIDIGAYRIVLHRQCVTQNVALKTGFGTWKRGWFLWTGRLRNDRQLIAKLGLQNSTKTSEVVCAALAQWGMAGIANFEGQFCLAVIDEAAQQVIWFRDQFGLVPTIYEANEQRAWIATCLCGFEGQQSKSRPFDVNQERLAKYLMRFDDGSDEDFFMGVRRIKPGWSLSVDIGETLQARAAPYGKRSSGSSGEERLYFRRMRHKIADVVEAIVSGEEPCCVSLSSGLDSALITSSWKRRWEEGSVPHKPVAATMAFPHYSQTDESERVKQLSKLFDAHLSIQNMEDVPPLDSLDHHHEYWGYGPCFHPGESYESEFLRRVRSQLGIEIMIHGAGGELLFPYHQTDMHVVARQRCWKSGDVQACVYALQIIGELWRNSGVKQTLISLLRANGVRLGKWGWPLRYLRHRSKRDGVTAEWWTNRTSLLAYRSLSTARQKLDSWHWELGCRMGWREQLRSGVLLEFPYLDGVLFDLAGHLPNSFLGGKRDRRGRTAMRRLAASVVPEQDRSASKHGLFEHYIWASWAENPARVQRLVQFPRLEELQLVHPHRVAITWRMLYERIQEQQEKDFAMPLGTLQFWAPLSAEIWLDER